MKHAQNMKLHHWIPALLCGLLFATSSLAEEQIPEALPWYEIEVIIFTRDLQPASLNEAWPSNPGTPDFDNARPLQTNPADKLQPAEIPDEGETKAPDNRAAVTQPTTASAATDEHSTLINKLPTTDTRLDTSESSVPLEQQLPEPYALLPEDELKLKTEFKRLQRSKGLHPEIHLAWRQPVTDRKKAQLLYLRTPYTATEAETELERAIAAEIAAEATVGAEIFSGFEETAAAEPPDLEGTIRISVNRYLHIELDLLRRIKPTDLPLPYEHAFEDGFIQQSQTYNSYRMQAHRRMRSGELHYIDHPLMGVLIKITPYELPKPIPAAPIEPEVTEQSVQTEGVGTAESNEAATEQRPAPASQKQDTTTSIIEIPIKSTE